MAVFFSFEPMLTRFDFLKPKPGSFAHYTYMQRIPKIIEDVIAAKDLDEASIARLQELKAPINFVVDKSELQGISTYWNSFLTQYQGFQLKEVPFLLGEIYWYQLLYQAVNSIVKDPFQQIKQADLIKNMDFVSRCLSKSWTLKELVYVCVEGNSADLSQIDGSAHGNTLTYLLDEADAFSAQLQQENHLAVLCDNAGVELFTDLMLVVHLLENKRVKQVTLHLKEQPIFVSDATHSDFDFLLDTLGDIPFTAKVKHYLSSGSLYLQTSSFWHSPTFYLDLPSEVLAAASDCIVLSKGDANYRRFFEDRDFPPSERIELPYKFKGVFAFRTLKSELQTGLDAHKVSGLNREFGKDWMTKGTHAVVQRLA